jgi:hypothetical protein
MEGTVELDSPDSQGSWDRLVPLEELELQDLKDSRDPLEPGCKL